MLKYIWLNPVTTNMLNENNVDINHHLTNLGYTMLDIDSDIINKVKQEYIDFCDNNSKTIIDSRCPKAVEIIKKHYPCLCKNIAPIDPIFISCANKLYNSWVKNNEEAMLFMISPCNSLCSYGNAVLKKGVVFLTWKEFCNINNINIDIKPNTTPIPLGFFDDTNLRIKKLTGEESIINNIKNLMQTNTSVNLIEILYCMDGCHNGDGI